MDELTKLLRGMGSQYPHTEAAVKTANREVLERTLKRMVDEGSSPIYDRLLAETPSGLRLFNDIAIWEYDILEGW